MGLFSKKVKDADLCFIRVTMEVAGVLAKVTSLTVAKEWMKQVMNNYSLLQKSFEYASSNIVALDCYSSDPVIKYKRAQELLMVAKTLNLPGMAHCEVVNAASACIKRMGFSYQDKINLVTSCIYEPCGIKNIDDNIINTYMNNL